MAFAACFPLLLQSVDLVLHELSLNDFKLWKCDGNYFFFYSHKITDNPDNVLTFRPHDLAEYSAEWVMTYIFVLY